jgi:hypothetical protein
MQKCLMVELLERNSKLEKRRYLLNVSALVRWMPNDLEILNTAKV